MTEIFGKDKPLSRIEEIDVERIVDEVAKCGRKGLHLYEEPIYQAVKNLGFRPRSENVFERISAELAAAYLRKHADANFGKWPELAERLVKIGPVTLHLTSKEWGKRLAGKTEEEIEKLLDGCQST